ncbi:distal tail protein Dit [Paenibacillus sp. FSL H7-0357]|uniref:distal tail protein Dit n=1 Tax=Paenibacillus sp. FSL H7-0357 TaxID=1536774 RepID=UPI001E2A4693|nr:distal tail protein Dit [Paenibacillus sp. FSL H7-0357]
MGDKRPQDLGLQTLRESQRPILPPTVDRIYTVPYMHGAYDFGSDMGPRSLPLECAFMERNSYQLQRRVSALAAHLVDGDGRPRTMSLIFSNQPDRHYMVRLSGQLPIDRMVGLGKFSLPMVAYDPFAYSIYDSDDINVDSPVLVDTEVSVDAAYEFAVTGPVTLVVDNFGALNVKPVIEIAGSFGTLSLTVGGVVTTYNAAMSGTLILDFQRGTARIGSTNLLLNTNARFGALSPGVSSVIVGGTGLNFSMSIKFKAKYAG